MPSREQVTFRQERWRAVAAGIIESAGSTFLLLIAVVWFEAGATAKGLIASGTSIGLLVTPLVVATVARRQWPVSRAAAVIFSMGSLCFLVAAVTPHLPFFIGSSVLGMACSSAVLPLLTQIYQNNYPAKSRGRLFSKTFLIRLLTTILFGKMAGDFLSGHIQWFPLLLLAFSIAFLGAALAIWKVPTQPLTDEGGSHPFRALRFFRSDALFRRTLLSWMILGFANLMMLPLRVDYLANPRYNLALSVAMVALLTEVIPNVTRLALSQVWGSLFDRINFFLLRAVLNVAFAVSIVAFFSWDSMIGLFVGAAIYGIARSGGDVAWSLWVTKIAPERHVADYMAVHTFFTGIRGFMAPNLAFHLALVLPLSFMAYLAAGMITVATLMLIPEIHFGPKVRDGQPLVEEVAD